jgi:hypothetical protein
MNICNSPHRPRRIGCRFEPGQKRLSDWQEGTNPKQRGWLGQAVAVQTFGFEQHGRRMP